MKLSSIRGAAAMLLSALTVAYLTVLMLAASEVTPPGSTWPDLHMLDRALFAGRAKPISAIERLLEAADGPMNAGGTMRPAFTTESTIWQEIVKQHNSQTELQQLLAEREGERLALLDWVRTGANRQAYENDAHPLPPYLAQQPLTSDYLDPAAHVVRIRTLIGERCAVCHSENGRNEKARSFPLDNYDDLHFHCQPRQERAPDHPWITAALAATVPLSLLAGLTTTISGLPASRNAPLLLVTLGAAVAGSAIGWLGQPSTFAASGVAVALAVFLVGLIIQATACAQVCCAQPKS